MTASALHAKLGASSSDRWMNCPGSIAMSEGMPNEQSVYAREGSCAHEIASHCLENNDDPHNWIGEEVEGFEDIEVDSEMAESIDVYMESIALSIAEYRQCGHDDEEVVYEHKFDLTHIYPDMFGTADCVIYFPQWKKLMVFDFKYGKGIAVEVDENSQLMYYGLGALSGKHNRPIDQVELVIVQPRCSHRKGPIRSWALTVEQLLDFTDNLVKAAERTKLPDAPLKVGDWCKFCPGAGKCHVLSEFAFETALAEFTTDGEIIMPKPEDMTPEQLKTVWQNASILDGFVKSVKAYAHHKAIGGELLPGTKLVNGRAYRRWKSKEGAEETLKGMVEVGMLEGEIHTTKLKSPAQIETMCGKKHKKMIEKLWEHGVGKLSLVPIEDDRPPARVDAVEEFAQ